MRGGYYKLYEYSFQAQLAYQMKLSPLPSKSNQLLLGVLFYLLDCRQCFLVPVGVLLDEGALLWISAWLGNRF